MRLLEMLRRNEESTVDSIALETSCNESVTFSVICYFICLFHYRLYIEYMPGSPMARVTSLVTPRSRLGHVTASIHIPPSEVLSQ